MAFAQKKEKSLPYFRWYPADHAGSIRVQDLHWKARALHRELIDYSWKKGYIIDDVAQLARFSGLPLHEVIRYWPKVRELWKTLEGTDEYLLVNERLELERTEADRKRVLASVAGQVSAEKRNGRSTSVNGRSIVVVEESRVVAGTSVRSRPNGARPDVPISESERCPECGSRGAALAVGIHAPHCAIGKAAKLAPSVSADESGGANV
jgi:hypothetical protein